MIDSIRSLIAAIADKHGLDPLLVEAVAMVESGGDQWAYRYEPGYRWIYEFRDRRVSADTELSGQKTSWGLMQIMGAVARERGFREPFLTRLLLPAENVEYGCRHLAHLASRGFLGRDLVASWNAGTPRLKPDGTYDNQQYVDKVLAALRALGGDLA